jgi:hypothetical protein
VLVVRKKIGQKRRGHAQHRLESLWYQRAEAPKQSWGQNMGFQAELGTGMKKLRMAGTEARPTGYFHIKACGYKD